MNLKKKWILSLNNNIQTLKLLKVTIIKSPFAKWMKNKMNKLLNRLSKILPMTSKNKKKVLNWKKKSDSTEVLMFLNLDLQPQVQENKLKIALPNNH